MKIVHKRSGEVYRPGLNDRICKKSDTGLNPIQVPTHIIFPDGNNLIFGNPSASHSLNVGNGHVTHYFPSDFPDSGVSISGSEKEGI